MSLSNLSQHHSIAMAAMGSNGLPVVPLYKACQGARKSVTSWLSPPFDIHLLRRTFRGGDLGPSNHNACPTCRLWSRDISWHLAASQLLHTIFWKRHEEMVRCHSQCLSKSSSGCPASVQSTSTLLKATDRDLRSMMINGISSDL